MPRALSKNRFRSWIFAIALLLPAVADAAWTGVSPGLEAFALPGRPTLLVLPGTGSNAAAQPSAPRVLVVADESPEGLRFVDPDGGALLGTLALSGKPVALALDSAGARAYVLTENDRLKVVNVAARTLVSSFHIGGNPKALLLRESGGAVLEVLVAQKGPDRVVGLDPASGALLRSVALERDPSTLAWAAGGTRLLAGARHGRLYAMDAATFSILSTAQIGDEIKHLSFWEAGGLALAAHKRSDGVSLVDIATGQVTAFVALDGDPERGAVDAASDRAYITTHDDFSVNRLDLLRRALDGRYALPERASGSVFDPISRKLLVSQRGDRRLLRLDPAEAPLISVLELHKRLRDIAVSNATHEAVAVADKSDEATRIRLADRATATVALPARPRFVALDTALNLAVVGHKNRTLRFIDTGQASPVLLPQVVTLADEPEALAVDATRALTVALTDSKKKIHFVSNAWKTLLSSVSLNEDTEALAIHPGRGLAYVLSEKKKLLLVNLDSRSVVQTIALSFRGNAIAVDEGRDRAVITTDKDNKAYVLDLATIGAATASLAEASFARVHILPRKPGAVAIQTDSGLAVVASKESDALSTIDLDSGALIAGFVTLERPFALAITSRYNQALVLGAEKDEVSFMQLPNPVPVLETLAPTQAPAGSAALTVTLTGKRFVDTSRVYFGANALTTRWLSHARLEADVPASLLASATSFQVIVRTPAPAGGDSNALAFTVVSATPVLTSIDPNTAPADGQPKVLSLSGQNFAASATVLFGASALTATVNSATSIGVTVPGALTQTPGTVNVSVVNPGNLASNSLPFTLTPALAITAISPVSGQIGITVTLTGTGFDASPAANQVVFRGVNNTTVAAAVLTASATQLTVRVPPLADTGPVTVTNSRGTVASPVFTVLREQDFQVVVSPAAVTAYQGASNSAQVQLSSTGTQPFTGIVALGATGLPAGVTATFLPAASLSASQPATLLLGAAAAAAPGTYAITVQGSFTESGQTLVRSATLNLSVQSSAAVTGVNGRFITPQNTGIAGVIVRADVALNPQPQTASDAAGNFTLVGLPAGPITLRFDATPANSLYPIWPYTTTIPANQVTVIADWTINPPPADEKFTPIANAAQEQVITDPRFPGLEIRLPAGVTIMGWDGVQKTRIAIEKVELTKLPVPTPPIPTGAAYQLYFGTPMGGVPSAPIPVTLPNDTGAEPGEAVNVWFFDGSPMGGTGEWKIAGAGIVSADGKTVRMPAGTGIPRFCGVCGLTCLQAQQGRAPDRAPTNERDCAGNPVDLSNGQEMPVTGGLRCGGLTPIHAGMSYNPVDAFAGIAGTATSLGFGWTLDYDIAFLPFVGAQKRLVLPGNNRVNFVDDGAGNYKAFDDPRFDGAVISATNLAANEWQLRFRDGRFWRFKPFSTQLVRGAAPTLVTEMVDTQGNALAIERRSDGRINSVGTGERGVSLSYGANGFVSEIRDTAGRTTRYAYTATNRLASLTDPDGRVTSYTYVGDSEFTPSFVCGAIGTGGERLKTIQYPGRPAPTENFYGPGRRVLRQVGYDGRETRFAYRVTGACVTHLSSPPSRCTGPACPEVDSWENFEAGWRIFGGQVVATTVTEPNGRTRSAEFNARGVGTARTDASGQKTATKLDSANRVTERTDALGRTWRYQYDAQGNVSRETDPLGRTTDYTYHPVWNKVTSLTRFDEASQPQTWTFTYDQTKGTLLSATNPLNQTTSFAYTARGELETLTSPLSQVTRFAYNAAGDLTEVIDPLGNETRLGLDGAGRRIATTDALGFITRTAYNGVDRVTKVTDARGKQTLMAYDPAGRLGSVTNARGFAIETYGYDGGDRLTARTDAKLKSTAYEYDAAGRLARTTDRRGQVTSYAYDEQDRVVSITRPEGATRFVYDAVGRLTEISDPAGAIGYAYDAVDRLVRETQAVGGITSAIEYAYDALDRRTSRTVQGVANEVTIYGYNRANRLTSIGYRGQTTLLEYDAAGRLTRKILPNALRQEFGYDGADRLESITYKKPDDTVIEAIAYGYDANGRRVTETKSTNPLPDTAFTAAYDEADRMTALTLTATAQSFALAYDDNGNLASKVETANPSNLTLYSWDSRNRLTGITSPGVSATFEYDVLNHRIARTVNGATTRYLYDGLQALGEVVNGEHAGLLTGLGIDEVIARYTSAGARTYLTDALNSVLAQTREDQSVLNYYAYSPYGEAQTLGPDEGNPLQYTGRENDGTGLYYYRARYYDPVLKRFVSEDPIGLAGGVNQYAYVNDSPITFNDPSGHLVDTFVDIGAIFYDLYRLAKDNIVGDCDNLGENLAALGADVLGAIIPGATGLGLGVRAVRAGKREVEIVQRATSRAELEATRSTGLLRGGRGGTHYVSDAVNSDALRARQRLALPQTPEVRVTMEVPAGRFSQPTKVQPTPTLPGGGTERLATGDIPVRILRVDPY